MGAVMSSRHARMAQPISAPRMLIGRHLIASSLPRVNVRTGLLEGALQLPQQPTSCGCAAAVMRPPGVETPAGPELRGGSGRRGDAGRRDGDGRRGAAVR